MNKKDSLEPEFGAAFYYNSDISDALVSTGTMTKQEANFWEYTIPLFMDTVVQDDVFMDVKGAT